MFGAHVIVYSKDAGADRAFFRDVLGLPWVDAGHSRAQAEISPTSMHPGCPSHGAPCQDLTQVGRAAPQCASEAMDP